MQVFQSLGCSFFHFSPQDHVFSLWFPQFPVAFWLWAHHQEPWLRNGFEVISHPTLYYFSFFFLPTSFTSQGLLFPTRRNLKPKSMGKQQSKSSGAKSSGCFQALTQAPYAMTNYIRRLDLTAHGASHAWYFFLIMLISSSHLKQPSPKPSTNSNPTHPWRPRWGPTSRKPPLNISAHRYPNTSTQNRYCTYNLYHKAQSIHIYTIK